MTKAKTALILAGGTGGHIFPGLALAQELKSLGWHVEWMGTADRMEADIVPKHDIPIHFIDVKGIRGNGLIRKLKMPLMLINALRQARNIIKKVKPNIVIGFGGYASGPGGIAAKTMGVPLMIHEQNAVLGMTNRWLNKVANKTLLAFPLTNKSTQVDAEVVGNPVRTAISELASRNKKNLDKEQNLNILVIGGSLGARVLNESLPELFDKLSQNHELNVRHQTGKGNQSKVEQAYAARQNQVKSLLVQVDEFIDDMPAALLWSDLVICRAGALTVSELAASGNVGVFIPLPHAVDDHQTANANWLVDQGAGFLIPQTELKEKLEHVLSELLLSPTVINDMQEKSRSMANSNTLPRMVQLCQELEVSS